MSDTTTPTPKALIPDRLVGQRYGVCSRTIARWGKDPALNFPPVIKIRGRRYRDAVALDLWDRTRGVAVAGRAP